MISTWMRKKSAENSRCKYIYGFICLSCDHNYKIYVVRRTHVEYAMCKENVFTAKMYGTCCAKNITPVPGESSNHLNKHGLFSMYNYCYMFTFSACSTDDGRCKVYTTPRSNDQRTSIIIWQYESLYEAVLNATFRNRTHHHHTCSKYHNSGLHSSCVHEMYIELMTRQSRTFCCDH